MRQSDPLHREICAVIRQRLGLELAGGPTSDLDHAIARIRAGFPDVPEQALPGHLAMLDEGSVGWTQLITLLTVGETYFFRDASWFEALESRILLPLIDERRRQADFRLRLWSAGCATGEEPYSLAMLLDRLLPDRSTWSLSILATDINSISLEVAGRGLYRAWSFREVPGHIASRYFRARGDGLLELDPAIREMVAFAPLNLVGDQGARATCDVSNMDVVICRNVIMYFSPAAQAAVAGRLAASLGPGGWLLTSSAETRADLFHPLSVIHLPGLTGFRATATAAPAETVAGPERRSSQARALRGQSLQSLVTSNEPRLIPAVAARDEPPPQPEQALSEARALADRGDYAEARALCEDWLARAALDYDGHLLHAQICQELGDRDKSRKALRRALYLRPDSVPAHFLLGNLHESEGEHEAACRCMRNVIDLALAGAQESGSLEGDGDDKRLLDAAKAFLQARQSAGRRRHGNAKRT